MIKEYDDFYSLAFSGDIDDSFKILECEMPEYNNVVVFNFKNNMPEVLIGINLDTKELVYFDYKLENKKIKVLKLDPLQKALTKELIKRCL